MKPALLFLNGNPPAIMPDLTDRFVVCADGAYNYVAEYRLPDVVLGDFDSADLSRVDPSVTAVRFPVRKNFTDGHLAIEYLGSRGYADIEIYGATGGRADHELCNYSLLAYARELGLKAALYTDTFVVRLLDGDYTGTAKKGAVISLVPFSDVIHILYTKGLKYEAVGLRVDKIHIISVSNEAVGGEFSVSVTGSALLFVER